MRVVKADVILKPNVDCKFAPPTAFVQNEMEQKIKRQTMLFQGGIPVFCPPSIAVAQSIDYLLSITPYLQISLIWNKQEFDANLFIYK